jgi:U3 small nucleolar RNA-associated protein 4
LKKISGVDPVLKIYSNVNVIKEGVTRKKWVRSVNRNIHQHDVRAIVSLGIKCISGGIDGYLTVSTYPPKQVHRYGPFLQAPCVFVAAKARLTLLKYINYLEIWKLGSATDKRIDFVDKDEPAVKRKTFELHEHPEKLLELRSKHDENIVCAALSADGHWLSYANNSTIRLFKFTSSGGDGGSKPTLQEVRNVPKEYFTPCRNMLFSPDGKFFYLVQKNNRIDVFAMDVSGISYFDSINEENGK